MVLKGLISFKIEVNSTQFAAGSTFDIPVHVLHAMKGLEDDIYLLFKEKEEGEKPKRKTAVAYFLCHNNVRAKF